MFNSVLAIFDENAFLILVDVGLLFFFFWDDHTDNTVKDFDIADVLLFLSLALFWY